MKKSKYAVAALVGAIVAGNAQAAGFEKSVMWSGKEAGYAGAGVGRISGSQSIAFNPAGLAGESDASLNFSPTWIKLEGSVVSSAAKEKSDHNFSPIGALSASYKVNDRLGLGIAAYVAGGSKAKYDNVNFPGTYAAMTLAPTIQTDFRVMEYALGGGYEVAPGWRVGAAWRIVEASGGLSTAKYLTVANAINYVSITDAKQTKYNGFRLGVQYTGADDDWGFGASFRNTVNFNAEGKINGTVQTITGVNVAQTYSPNATIGTSLPWAASVGGHYRMGDFRLLGTVDYVKYSKNAELKITALQGTNALPNIPLQWKDMWNFRVGTEYSGFSDLKLRLGYSLTTKVTSPSDARATLTPPGAGHLFSVGAGTTFWERFELDGAFEYAVNSADGSMTAGTTGSGASTSRELLAGTSSEFKANTIGIHTGVTYKF